MTRGSDHCVSCSPAVGDDRPRPDAPDAVRIVLLAVLLEVGRRGLLGVVDPFGGGERHALPEEVLRPGVDRALEKKEEREDEEEEEDQRVPLSGSKSAEEQEQRSKGATAAAAVP